MNIKKDNAGKVIEVDSVKIGDKFKAEAWLAGKCLWEVVGFRLDIQSGDYEAVCRNLDNGGPFNKFSISMSVKTNII